MLVRGSKETFEKNIFSFNIKTSHPKYYLMAINNKLSFYNDAWQILPVNHRLLDAIMLSLIRDLMRESRHVATSLID